MRLALLGLMIVGCGAATPRPDTWRLSRDRHPAAGDRFHLVATSEETMSSTGTVANQPMPPQSEATRAVLEAEVEVLEVGEERAAARFVVVRCVESELPLVAPGTVIEQRREGATTALTCNGAPCGEAEDTIEDLMPNLALGGHSGARDALLFDEAPHGVGDTWHPPAERLVESVGTERRFTLDPDRTSAMVTLREHAPRGGIEGSTVVGELRSNGMTFPISGTLRESSLDASFGAFVPDEPRHPILSERVEMRARFVVDVETPAGPALVTFVATIRRSVELTPQ